MAHGGRIVLDGPLSEIVEAHRYLDSIDGVAKTVVLPGPVGARGEGRFQPQRAGSRPAGQDAQYASGTSLSRGTSPPANTFLGLPAARHQAYDG